MKKLFFILVILLASGEMVSAQAWKTGEQKKAINRKADLDRRILNNQRALKNVKDSENKKVYETRIATLNEALALVEKQKEKIEAGDRENTWRYYEMGTVKLRKVEAMQMLINIRLSEIAYEAFGGDMKEEMISVYEALREKVKQDLRVYDEAIKKIEANIK